MSKKNKLKAELILEVAQLQERVAELEVVDAEQKHALETLSDSERRFKTIFSDAAIGIDIVDDEGSPIIANRALQEMLGYSEDELRSLVFADYTHPEDIEESLRLVQDVREGKRDHFTMEKRYIRKDGDVIWGRTSVSGMHDARGNFQYFIAMAEEALRKSEQQLSLIFNQVGDVLFFLAVEPDDCFRFLSINQAFLDATGLTIDQIVGKRIEEVIPEPSLNMVRDNYKKAIEENRLVSWEETSVYPAGKKVWEVNIAPVLDKTGICNHLVGSVHNITEHKLAEYEVQVERDNLRNVLGTMEDGVYIVDQLFNIEYVNLVLETEFGPYEGHKCYAYFHDRDEVCPWCKNEDVFAGKTVRWEWALAKNQKTYDLIDTPLKNRDGSISKLEILRDITERVQAEESIRESETRIRDLIETVPIGISISAPEGDILEVNTAMLEIFGYDSKEEFLNINAAEHYIDLKDREQFIERIEKGSDKDLELQYKRKDGSIFWGSTSSLITETAAGDTQYINTLQDITERKQGETNLLKNQYYLTKAQEIGIIGIWELDIQKNDLTWTDENYKIFGVPPGTEMNYELFLNCIHPDDKEYVNEKWNAALNHEPYDIEHRVIVNNEIKWVREKAEIDFDTEGQPILAIGFTQDVTERKLAAGKLIESEAFIKNVMDNLPIGLAVNSVDPTVEFNYMNDSFTNYYRTTREALESKGSFWNAVYEDPVYREQIRKRVLDDVASGDPEQMHWVDIPITRKGEETTFISARNTPLPGTQLMVSTVWDVSERKNAELEKDSLLKQVQVANERLQSLSRALIHSQEEERKHIAQELHDELGSALTAISLDLGLIERELEPDTAKTIVELLSETRIMVDELDQMISELALDLRPSLLDDLGLLPALGWYVDRYSQRAEVEIEMDIIGLEERLPPEIETTLYRVFQEALTNVARHAQASKVRLQIDRRPTTVFVTIEDDGGGFNAEEFQIGEVPLRSIGLVGMKERISLLGGRLEIHSKPGEGTRIDIEIPL